MSTETVKIEGSPRERLLAAANELFYAHGVHSVGIDRVIDRAGVAKASLYSTFGSKEELVRAYLEGRGHRRRERILARIAQHADPREKILSVYGLLAEIAAEPGFRGCAFVNASAEEPRDGVVREASARARTWVRELFVGLARDAGARDPAKLGRRLGLLYDAAIVSASMDRDPTAPNEARTMAQLLLDLELTSRSPGTRPSSRRPSRAAGASSSRKH
ncbi:MAG: TetR/AcrR family transcriptional regulator [Myxococcaceae bacterium]|nr:TetR/AcrR family transcriptional regulator [Myxococcaceae bacterium]